MASSKPYLNLTSFHPKTYPILPKDKYVIIKSQDMYNIYVSRPYLVTHNNADASSTNPSYFKLSSTNPSYFYTNCLRLCCSQQMSHIISIKGILSPESSYSQSTRTSLKYPATQVDRLPPQHLVAATLRTTLYNGIKVYQLLSHCASIHHSSYWLGSRL